MSLKENIAKWVFLSAAKHFTSSISGITTFVESTERLWKDDSSWIEIRIDGPYISEICKDVFKISSEINLLVATQIDPSNPVGHVINTGKAVNAFRDFIIYRYGDDSDDDGEMLGSFFLKPGKDLRDKVAVSNMGQINPDLKLLQTTVEGHFEMFVDKE